MLRLTKTASVITLALTATPVLAQWVNVSTSTTGAEFSIDPARITVANGRAQAWAKIDFSKDATVAYRSEMRLYSFICASRKLKILAFTEYDSYNRVIRSESVNDYAYSDVGYSPVTPETVAETIMEIACAKS